MQACPHPFPFDARCLSFGCDVLKCACGGTRTLIAAVKKPTEIERQADWDDVYESEELMKAQDENWAA